MRVRTALVVLVVAAAWACGGGPERARRFAQRGDEYFAAARYDAAIIEYRNAVKAQPSSAEAHRKLADAYAAAGRAEEAYRAFAAAADLDPSDAQACLGAGRLLLASGLSEEAHVRAEQVLDRAPRNVDAMILAGRALLRLNRRDEAIGAFQTAIAADARPAAYIGLGDVKLAAGDLAGAEKAYRAALASAPHSIEAGVALARFLAAANRRGEAEAAIRAVVADHPSDELANRAAASFYIDSGRLADAEPYLKAAAGVQTQKLHSTLALADYYLSTNRDADAKALLERITGDRTERTAARVRLAAIEFEAGSADKAWRILDDVLKKSPTADAWALEARILLRDGKKDNALWAARAALDLDPNVASAHYVVGTIELERGRLAQAEHEFRELLRLNKLTSAAKLQLARTMLAAGHADEAIELAEALGDDPAARITLARALIADRQLTRARAELQRLEAEGLRSAEPAVLLGSLALENGDVAEARAQAARALSIAPELPEALLLAGRSALEAADSAAAEQYLTRAVARDPSSFDAHALLARVFVGRRAFDRARAVLEPFAERNPQSADARTAVGLVLQAAGRDADARSWYEQALAIDPAQPIAANNLARIYAADRTNIEAAVRLARIAALKLPDEPEVQATLARVNAAREAAAQQLQIKE